MSRHRSSNRRLVSARIAALVPALAFLAIGAAACGADDTDIPLPLFEGGPGVATNAEGGDGASDGGELSEASTNEGGGNEASTDAPTGDGSTTETSLVISQVQSRGTGSASDEFIEIYNPTGATIMFDATWTISVRNATAGTAGCAGEPAGVVYTGANQAILSHHHLLLTASAYSEATTSDATFSAGISDAANVVLLHVAAVADALCFSYDASSVAALTTCTIAYTCEGTPATNPHDNTTGTNTDASLERKPGGAGGNGTDVNDNAADFASNAAADPHDLASAATP